MKRTRGKIRADAMSFTAELDGTEHLQVYVHNFEGWDSTSTIPATFTPLTVNDVDVGELTLYDSLGNASALDVNAFYDSSETSGSGKMRMIPAYAIAIVGINESAAMAAATGSGSGNTGGSTNTQQVKITEIKLHKNAWWYEPWWLGKAEIYFVQYVPEAEKKLDKVMADLEKCKDKAVGAIDTLHGGLVSLNYTNCAIEASPKEWFGLALGRRTNFKQYKVWKWKKRWWGGYYKQSKPWRTMNYDTGWKTVYFDYSKEYKLRVIEYDWPGYDRGAYGWCAILGGTVWFLTQNPLIGFGVGFLCAELLINDDPIGSQTGFQKVVKEAADHPGTEYLWSNYNFDWEIKLKVE
ncbi:hypothetical protein JYT44_03430 [Caldithrix abyssi]|nr:hypothetical protein [Caldithrix abyssi]